ncbi:TetR/AcrR family transcriptional regulator [Nonomuraea typhae]|uniref:TetR/AcrR family transcriptional regulator n=1 Tax=Nonomuraea typhae TaxID=2603600 RepID=UPI001C6727D4
MNSQQQAGRRERGRPPGPGVTVEQRRADLLDAAERAIRARGPAVSMADIAREAGYARSALYAMFADRASVLTALSERHAERIYAAIADGMRLVAEPRGRFRVTLDVLCRWVEAEPHLYRVLSRHPLTDEGPDRGLFDVVSASLESLLRSTLRASGADPAPAAPWARAMVGSMAAAVEWWLREDAMSRDALVEHLTDLFWDGGAALPPGWLDVRAAEG